MSLYLSQLSFCPPFLLLAGKDRRHETFPLFFSSLTRPVKTSRREEVCHFSPTTNQQNVTAPLHWRDHLSLKGPRSSGTFFVTPEMNVLKGHQEHILYCILKLQHLAVSILFSFCTKTSPISFSLL